MRNKVLIVSTLGIILVFNMMSAASADTGKYYKDKHQILEEHHNEDKLEKTIVREVLRGLVRVLSEPDRPSVNRVVIVDDSPKRVVKNSKDVVVLVAEEDFEIEVDEDMEVVDIKEGTTVEVEEGTEIIRVREESEISIPEKATLLIVREYPRVIRTSRSKKVKVVRVTSRPVVVKRPVRVVKVHHHDGPGKKHGKTVIVKPKVKVIHRY
jgi:PHD/YefM family antitoxin component YafN of YafNO toxin-antitoxin module